MKKSILGMIAIASMAMVGCTQDVEQLVVDDMKNVEFTGTIEDADTRTSMDNTGKVIWCENDPISIFMRNGNHYKYQANEGGTANTAFVYANWYAKGSATLDQNYAVYPFDESNAFDASTKTFTVDLSELKEQTYTENNFEEGKSVMTAKASDTDLPFYNALSMLKVKLHSDVPEAYRIEEIKIESETLALSGEDATIDLSGEDGKVAAVLASGDKSITLDCGEEGVVVSIEPTDFYILLPANSVPAGDFTITITATNEFTGDEYIMEETIAKDFSFERSKIVTYGRKLTAEDWTGSIEDVIGTNDIVMKDDHAEVSTANGLLKWAYIANNKDNTYGLKLMNDIEMPALEIEEDAVNETYKFTEKAIAVTDGVPSGSNWIPITMYENVVDSKYFKGNIEGNSHSISGLLINADNVAVGFVGWMHQGATLKNVIFDASVIYNAGGNQDETYTGAAVGRSHNGTLVENVHITNSKITGKDEVGGVVGRNYRRDGTKNNYDEEIAYIKKCTTDVNTVISGSGGIGGICGVNYGAVVIGCINNANVSGETNVGGIAGISQDYWGDKNNEDRVYDGYVIGCSSNGNISSSTGNCGGIIGYTRADVSNHKYTKCYIVACVSTSTISGSKAHTMIGYVNTLSTVIGSWAEKCGEYSIYGGSSLNLIESAHYSAPSDITEDVIVKMNSEIAKFNNLKPEGITCPYEWSLTGSWPVLVEP